ncbi:hypothetical protein [Nocardia spumae]|uniref:hypothetical protein n=1 Tax=Nocardia spumae TaxID=2887190 RepID=UPI001D1439E0|nr:hypothetical protein [Nocardia spumae]
MSSKLIAATPSADLLVEEIIDRYGSVGQFCDLLRRDLDDPTVELPRVPVIARADRVRVPKPPNIVWSEDGDPPPAVAPAAKPPANTAAEVNRRRGLWQRLLTWFC